VCVKPGLVLAFFCPAILRFWFSSIELETHATKLNQKCEMVGQKNVRWSGREIEPKMQAGRAKKCTTAEQKLNQKCEMAGQKNVRWSSRN
jgi:hypothetical protein